MAKVTLILDTRAKSKSKRTGLFPVVLKVNHKQVRMVRMDVFTLPNGWDEKQNQLRKSAYCNKFLDCESLNAELNRKFYIAKQLLLEIGDSIHLTKVDNLIVHIRKKWDYNPDSEIKKKVENELSLEKWGNIIVNRKLRSDAPGTAEWLVQCINAIKRYNGNKDIKLYDITVTFLKNFEAYNLGKGNSKNTIGIYLRGIRVLYNNAINEDQFVPFKNSFQHYKIPPQIRTKKRAIPKHAIMAIKNLRYEPFGALWNARNYALVMFYCRGMNFIDLVKIKKSDINNDRLHYGRSKTGTPLSVKVTEDLQEILGPYQSLNQPDDFLFPTNYDGSTLHFQKYKTQRRRMNERLRIIAKDANIDGKLTTYTIRHSWATIAKYMGISTALISEALGHSSIQTTEIYLKDFHNEALDAMNERVTAS